MEDWHLAKNGICLIRTLHNRLSGAQPMRVMVYIPPIKVPLPFSGSQSG